ncbi:glycine zipper 2TM domain-containing protein [Janthinobacterium sp. 17J80-10]|uniref:glycine zipper 2TM domain-containing protein n=1 Tax=Janthinobacterium sp. 17J80-10 TaxID=2497863 RepID=UPI0010052F87|nr:glycine zipper 2TM domain-containing protein [Janthinobacterium sp. 17J80-10]QAU35409.1 glycine zipper 2TM domain-containing protein [Janthinobacterium sp. 17J80-10]
MKNISIRLIATLATSTMLGACANTGYSNPAGSQPYPSTGQNYPTSSQPYQVSYGTVESIQLSPATASQGVGAGAIIGGVVGGVLGNQVGSGSGRTAATVAGAVGGALAGNEIEKRRDGVQRNQYQIGVRLDNGAYQTVVQDNIYDLQVGARVRIQNNTAYRY